MRIYHSSASLFVGLIAMLIPAFPLFAQDMINSEANSEANSETISPSKSEEETVLAPEYTRVLFVDTDRDYVIFNKGKKHLLNRGVKVCILGEKKHKVYCSTIEAAIKMVSAYHVPKEILSKIPTGAIGRAYVQKSKVIFKEPPADDADTYADDGVKTLDSNPFFATKAGIFIKGGEVENKLEAEKRRQIAYGGFSFGYLYTAKTPSTYRTVYYKTPSDAATSETNEVWSNQKTVSSSFAGLAMSYLGTETSGFNLVYDAYFRFASWRRNEQNFLPADDQSYVSTSQLAYNAGFAMGLSRQIGQWGKFHFRPNAGLGLERSTVNYEATAYGGSTQGNTSMVKLASQLYMLTSRLEMETLYTHDFVNIVFSVGSDIPLASTLATSGKPRLVGGSNVAYTADVDNNLKAHIDHKSAGPSAQMRVMLRYAF